MKSFKDICKVQLMWTKLVLMAAVQINAKYIKKQHGERL